MKVEEEKITICVHWIQLFHQQGNNTWTGITICRWRSYCRLRIWSYLISEGPLRFLMEHFRAYFHFHFGSNICMSVAVFGTLHEFWMKHFRCIRNGNVDCSKAYPTISKRFSFHVKNVKCEKPDVTLNTILCI